MRYLYIGRATGNPGACEVGESADPRAVANWLYGDECGGKLAELCAQGLESNPKGIETSGEYAAFPESAIPDRTDAAEFVGFVHNIYMALSGGPIEDPIGPYRRAVERLLEGAIA